MYLVLALVVFGAVTSAFDLQDVGSPLAKRLAPCKEQDQPFCAKWKGDGFCAVGHMYHQFMMKKCRGACGLCKLAKKPGGQSSGVPHNIDVKQAECLAAHNMYRAKHGAPALVWDDKMAREAKEYALKLAKIKKMIHEEGIPDGENLAMQFTWGSSSYMTCKKAAKAWYDEIKDYSYANPHFSMKTGHFTQEVWKNTKRLGVGVAQNGGFSVVVARYNPPGNFQGQFGQMVGRLVKK